jgi:4-hydroxy-tetrahydrodipicolinate synthase
VLNGVFPVLATPFHDDGTPDDAGLRRIARYAVEAGADGVVYPALASELFSLTEDERRNLLAVVAEAVGGRARFIACITAPDATLAASLAAHAEAAGADAVMTMAASALKDAPGGVRGYFEAIAGACNLPIVLQNAPAPLGSAQTTEEVLELVRAVPRIEYVKEENQPCGQRISQLLAEAPANLRGVFGGAGGRYIIDELERGAVGTMPACELTELHAALWRSWEHGDRVSARQLYNRSLPLLTFQAVFRMAMTKEVLRRRGIIGSAHVRERGPRLDQHDQKELTTLLAEIEDLLDPRLNQVAAGRAP